MRQSSIIELADWRQTRPSQVAKEPSGDFWPEASSRYSRENLPPMNPANSPQRVLFEVFLILAAAGMVVAAVTLWLPGTS